MNSIRARAIVLPLLFIAACTYGPEEERTVIGQMVRIEGTYKAFVIVQYDRFHSPTGLSAFPDGGKSRVLRREATQYLVDLRSRTVNVVIHQVAPDSLWESFSLWVQSLESDSVVYLRMTGCPRGGECHPAVQKTARFRLPLSGELQAVDDFPPGSGLPGEMLARQVGEEVYVRLSSNGGVISGRFEEDAPFEPLFRVENDGTLVPTSG